MKNYFIIEIPIVKGEKFSTTKFDKKAYEKANNITLIDEPITVNVKDENLILIFEGSEYHPKIYDDAPY